jgi:hypothetical protein
MTHHKKSMIIAILVLLLCPVAHAQDKPQTTDAARREKAIELLQSLATQLSTLQSPENRARIGANIADSLWAHDEKRARALFIGIEDDINWGLRVREVKTTRDNYVSTVFMKLRTDIVTRIAKHDAELALDFLRATAPTYEKIPRGALERERDFEVKLATQIVASNPDLALKIGSQSLSRGFSDHLLPLIKQLLKKHREHGVTLYKETVRTLKGSDFSHRGHVNFALSLAELTPPLADESAFRDFIDMWISAALANGCGKPDVPEDSVYFCDRVRFLVPQMQKVAPLRTGQLKRLAREDQPEPWEFARSRWAEFYQLLDEGDFDEALELAKRYPDMTDAIYWQTALRAQVNGDTERARKIVNDFIGDPEKRQELLARLKANESFGSVTDEELDQVQAELNKLEGVEEKLSFLVGMANRVGAKNRAAALKLLDQANGIIESMKPGKEQMKSQLGLALFYCTEKSDRCLAMMESLLPQLNELIDAAAKLDEFDTHYLRDGEWNMSANGTLGEILTYLSQNAAYYAWTDFDRAVSLAAQFERSEIRMMAQTKLAQSILGGPPKRYKYGAGLSY